jgi:glycosyltransferase involved in cell wall biosynthesis
MKTCVVMPAYNESKTIAALIVKVRAQGLDIVVIDDGSLDGTQREAEDAGALVLRNAQNEGKGASLTKGFRYALDKGFDAVICMDADGQHLPEDVNYFTRLAQYSESGIIIGNRMAKIKNMPLARVATNRFMSWLISLIAGQDIPDTQCGFRLIKKNVLERLKLRTAKYETESEILIKASKLGFRIESVPVKSIYSGERSQINPFFDTLRFVKFIVAEIWTTEH